MTPTLFLRSPGRKRRAEADFQRAIVQYLKIRYGPRLWILNHVGGIGQRTGIPDLLCCLDGRFLALEVKSPLGNGRLGPWQKEELEAIREAGGQAVVISSREDLEEILRAIDPGENGASAIRAGVLPDAQLKGGEADEVSSGLRCGLDQRSARGPGW